MVAVLMVVAALARASQVPLPMWLPGTLSAPTPTSALLHAGVVNAGAILLLRSLDLVAAAPAAMWLLAIASLVTIAASLAALRTRRDVKGALAVSTSAQMGFMLLAIAVGAPLAALTHLVGHTLYKSARFLGVGDAIGASVRRRSYAPSVAGWPQGFRVASSVVIGVAAGGLAALVFHGAEAWMVGGALAATAGIACWAWLGRVPAGVAPARRWPRLDRSTGRRLPRHREHDRVGCGRGRARSRWARRRRPSRWLWWSRSWSACGSAAGTPRSPPGWRRSPPRSVGCPRGRRSDLFQPARSRRCESNSRGARHDDRSTAPRVTRHPRPRARASRCRPDAWLSGDGCGPTWRRPPGSFAPLWPIERFIAVNPMQGPHVGPLRRCPRRSDSMARGHDPARTRPWPAGPSPMAS